MVFPAPEGPTIAYINPFSNVIETFFSEAFIEFGYWYPTLLISNTRWSTSFVLETSACCLLFSEAITGPTANASSANGILA